MGRPSKLTAKLQAELVANLESYCHRSIAAKLAGIDPATLRRWMAEGQGLPEGPFGAFRAAILEAESRAEQTLVRRVADASKEDPRNAQWLLTHRFAKRWADKNEKFEDRVKVAVEAGNSRYLSDFVDTMKKHLSREHLDALLDVLDRHVFKKEQA